jgi:hypothetical protein
VSLQHAHKRYAEAVLAVYSNVRINDTLKRFSLFNCNMRINDTIKRFSLFNCNMRINNTLKRFSLSQKAIQSVQRARIRMQNKATETFELVLPIPGREMRKLIQGA